MLPDLRHGWRLLARSRGSTAVVVLTLALGIGANVSLYSIARAVLLKPSLGARRFLDASVGGGIYWQ